MFSEILSETSELLFNPKELLLENITKDSECEEYFGCNFTVDALKYKFRKAKITPKKKGAFVTLWKRNAAGNTIPFEDTDPFDFYIIAVDSKEHFGTFLFPSQVLASRSILSTSNKEGKRGFRVYPPWVKAASYQALKTQHWQMEYWVENKTA